NEDALEMFRRFATGNASIQAGIDFTEERTEILSVIARLIGARNRPNEIAEAIALARETRGNLFKIISSLDDGLRQSGSSLEMSGLLASLQPDFRRAHERAMLRIPPEPIDTRLNHINFLSLAPYRDS